MTDVYFVKNTSRLKELFHEFQGASNDPFVGVGFFQSNAINLESGLNISCAPNYLQNSILRFVASGTLNPTDQEPFLLADSTQEMISRWVIGGLHSFVEGEKSNTTIENYIHSYFESLLVTLNGLRPHAAVFCLDFSMISKFMSALFPEQIFDATKLVMNSFLNWILEDCNLEQTILWCQSEFEYSVLLQCSRNLRYKKKRLLEFKL